MLLPPNSTSLEKALSEAMRIRLENDVALIKTLWDPWKCPIDILPWLAWALSVDIWNESWGEQEKRAAVSGSLAWHRKKGTPWAVKKVLASIGFDRSELIEHRFLYESWLAAGGEVIDGVGFINGDSDLSPPDGDFRFVTASWAEFALRLNVGEQSWVDSRQREIIEICKAYGPARSHLVAIILSALYDFDSTVYLSHIKQSLKTVFEDCRRFTVPSFDTLDGCDILGGGNEPDYIDGSSALDGSSNLSGIHLTGEALDGGQIGLKASINSIFQQPMLGGNRQEPPEILTGGMFLDGFYTISGPLLDGSSLLDGAGDLFYPTLATPDDTLDGTSNLGEVDGLSVPWFNGVMRIKNGTLSYQEPLR